MNKMDALTGALVGDAATMGLHWLYNQERLAQINASHEILFRAPTPADYEGPDGSLGYFAHAARQAGQFSQYGECIRLVGDLVANGESYTPAAHQAAFLERFGPGGDFVGYADRPTKALVARLLTEGDELPAASGSDDDQLPALAAVPALFATGADEATVTSAVSVTNLNDVAIDGALTLHRALNALASGASMTDALKLGADAASGEMRGLLNEALAMPAYAPLEAAQKFGMPCHLPQGLPVVWHIAQHATGYEQAIRDNILCGGDSCGRVVALGSLMGLAFGVPDALQRSVSQQLNR